MKNHLLKKVLALSLFVSGISVFVLHQSGYFSGNNAGAYQGSHNGGVLPVKGNDSVAVRKRDSLLTLMFSSKSAVPVRPLERKFSFEDSLENHVRLFGSSKVVIPVDSEIYKLLRATATDSLTLPDLKKKE